MCVLNELCWTIENWAKEKRAWEVPPNCKHVLPKMFVKKISETLKNHLMRVWAKGEEKKKTLFASVICLCTLYAPHSLRDDRYCRTLPSKRALNDFLSLSLSLEPHHNETQQTAVVQCVWHVWANLLFRRYQQKRGDMNINAIKRISAPSSSVDDRNHKV